MFEARGVSVRFGGVAAVDDACIEVEAGKIAGLIGPNGAGKSTLFNVCTGFQRPTRGRIELDGIDISGLNAVQRAKRGIGRTFQQMELFGSLSVLDNVVLAAGSNTEASFGSRLRSWFSASTEAQRRDGLELLELVGLGDGAQSLASDLSTGNERRLELARALATRPKYLLLDEPSSGLDVAETAAFGKLLVDTAAQRGVGILLVEHDMAIVMGICEKITVLNLGKVVAVGTPAQIQSSDVVREVYLGELVAQ